MHDPLSLSRVVTEAEERVIGGWSKVKSFPLEFPIHRNHERAVLLFLLLRPANEEPLSSQTNASNWGARERCGHQKEDNETEKMISFRKRRGMWDT